MRKAKVHFRTLILDVQDVDHSPDSDRMVSRLLFDLEVNGRSFPGLEVELSQPFGTRFEDEPIEVGAPKGYGGNWNHNVFAQLAEDTYRGIIGGKGRVIRTGGGSWRMRDSRFEINAVHEIEIP